jgi:uncharacterized coiled-coil protein SlyX
MSEGIDPQGGVIEVTPEEERFLKRFFRRHALPWFAAAVVIGVASAWGLSGGGDDGLEVRVSAALAQLRSENERLREQVSALAERRDSSAGAGVEGADDLEQRVENARRNVRMIEARVTAALDRRLDDLEARVAATPRRPGGDEPELPSEASAWDVSTILERLYALEMREGVSGPGSGDSVSAARLAELEQRLARVEQRGAPAPPPAAAAQ